VYVLLNIDPTRRSWNLEPESTFAPRHIELNHSLLVTAEALDELIDNGPRQVDDD